MWQPPESICREVITQSYNGADPAHLRRLRNSILPATPIAGFGQEILIDERLAFYLSFVATSLTKNSARAGLGLQASYTYAKSLDDTSAVSGRLVGELRHNLADCAAESMESFGGEGPSTFDVTHVFSASVIQLVPLDRISFLQPLGRTLTTRLAVSEYFDADDRIAFHVFSGIHRLAQGGGADRPIKFPCLGLWAGRRRADSGLGADNRSFFRFPSTFPGGADQGRFGTLDAILSGAGYHDFDFALIKDTPFGHRGGV